MSKHKLHTVQLCLYTHIKTNDIDTFRVRQLNVNRGKVNVALFITEKVEFKAEIFKQEKDLYI